MVKSEREIIWHIYDATHNDVKVIYLGLLLKTSSRTQRDSTFQKFEFLSTIKTLKRQNINVLNYVKSYDDIYVYI